MNCDPHWTAYLTAFATPVIGAGMLFIAYQQWLTSAGKLKLDLFEKRYKLYKLVESYLLALKGSGTIEASSVLEFRDKIRDAKWLLNEDIAHQFNVIFESSWELHILIAESESLSEDTLRLNLSEQSKIKDYLESKLDIISELCRPLLQLGVSSLLKLRISDPRLSGSVRNSARKCRRWTRNASFS